MRTGALRGFHGQTGDAMLEVSSDQGCMISHQPDACRTISFLPVSLQSFVFYSLRHGYRCPPGSWSNL